MARVIGSDRFRGALILACVLSARRAALRHRRQRDARQDPGGVLPSVFGPNADEPLDDAVVREKFEALAAEIETATGDRRSPVEVADGFKIAVDNMANAIKQISVQRGYDVTDYTLNCFGGAGGQHACLVADALGMTRVFVHPLPACCRRTAWASPSSIRERAVDHPRTRGRKDARRRLPRRIWSTN